MWNHEIWIKKLSLYICRVIFFTLYVSCISHMLNLQKTKTYLKYIINISHMQKTVEKYAPIWSTQTFRMSLMWFHIPHTGLNILMSTYCSCNSCSRKIKMYFFFISLNVKLHIGHHFELSWTSLLQWPFSFTSGCYILLSFIWSTRLYPKVSGLGT